MNDGTNFKKSQQMLFEDDFIFEDNTATFFDADADGDLDLYVGSGANSNPSYLQDRLYINNDGVFVKTKNPIPANSFVTSTVIAYDYDVDGDTDLFIGNYAILGDFGQLPSSYILINDGNGNFTKDENFELNARVTDAKWQDVNEDGTKDLVVTTEWDQPYLFLNNSGKLTSKKLPENLNGLWQSLAFHDMDGDGDKDLVLGNYGLNTKFNLYFDGPLRLYYGDFDENGVKETATAYNLNGDYYPLNTKDELAGQMNVISKRFKDHKSMAGQLIEDVLTPKSIKNASVFEVDKLASGYLKNENGNFTSFVELPKDFQLAPINSISAVDFSSDENKLLVGGNSYKMNTYHGAYNSLKGLLVENEKSYQLLSSLGANPIDEQLKSFAFIEMKDGKILVVIQNNAAIKTYSYK